jgi:hypothetical protein
MVGNGSYKWLGSLKRPHKVVTEAKDAQIKVSLSVPPLVNSNNH